MFTKWINLLLLLTALGACTEGFVQFPVSESRQSAKFEGVDIIRLNKDNIDTFSKPMRGYRRSELPIGSASDYKIGAGDLLQVIVFDHPELTLQSRAAKISGFSVQADGTFNFPFIGLVKARGLTADAVRSNLTKRLTEYFPSPQVEVRVAAFNSQRIVVVGQVNLPNTQKITLVPTTLIRAISAAGGLTDAADSRAISVQRGGRIYEIDLEGFLTAGIERNNPMLRAGDVVTVPRRRAQEAYLLGEVTKPAAVDLSLEPITLTQALTRQGGLLEVRADARGVFVFRLVNEQMTVYQLDASSPTGLLLGTAFVLEPSDVVYVVRSPLSKWNDTISGLLPSVTAALTAQRIGD